MMMALAQTMFVGSLTFAIALLTAGLFGKEIRWPRFRPTPRRRRTDWPQRRPMATAAPECPARLRRPRALTSHKAPALTTPLSGGERKS